MSRRRCQLLLDHDLWERLKADADHLGLSVSALVRQRLAGAGGLPAERTRPAPVEPGPMPAAKPLTLIEF